MTDSINALQYRGFTLVATQTRCQIHLGDRLIASIPTFGQSAAESLRAGQHHLDHVILKAA